MNPAIQHLEGKLLDYAYGELSEGEAKTVEAHLRDCPQCADSLAEMRQVRRTMSQLPMASAPQAGLESLLAYAQKAAESARARPARRSWLRWIAPIASVAALSVVLVISSKVARRPEAIVTLRQKDTRGDWESPPQLAAKKEAEAPAKETEAAGNEAKASATAELRQLSTPPTDWKGSSAPTAPEPAAPPSPERIAQRADGARAGEGDGARKAKVAAAPRPEPARRAEVAAYDSAARDSARDEELRAGVERRLAREGGGPGTSAIPGGVVGGTVASHPAADTTAEKQPSGVVASQPAGASVESKQAPSALGARSPPPSSSAERPVDREREVAQLRQALASGAQGQERARLLRRLCEALDALGRTREADSACDTVVREFPASEEAKSALERLKVRAAEPRR